MGKAILLITMDKQPPKDGIHRNFRYKESRSILRGNEEDTIGLERQIFSQ